MRYLILLRHAKAVASSPDGDFGRELAPRGRKNAARLGQWLATQTFAPRLVIASPARRASETANIVIAQLRPQPARVDERGLYNADAGDILDIARHAADDVDAMMLVGHNPGMAELAHILARPGDTSAHKMMARKFPTCACAVLAFEINAWEALAARQGRLLAFATPAGLDASETDD